MGVQSRLDREAASTDRTVEGFFTSVYAEMTYKVTRFTETFITVATCVGTVPATTWCIRPIADILQDYSGYL